MTFAESASSREIRRSCEELNQRGFESGLQSGMISGTQCTALETRFAKSC